MPKIRFADLPRELRQRLLARVEERHITFDDLRRLQEWAKSDPVAPDGDRFQDFGSCKLCGSGEYLKTILLAGMKPYGEEIY